MHHAHRPSAEVSTSSMADVAFLLLTFFLVTTVINNDKGITILLPELSKNIVPVHDRDLFSVQVNSFDQFLIEGESRKDLSGLREEIKKFILNPAGDPLLSENPTKAVITLKTDRGTSYHAFISALDEIQGAYFEIYASRTGLTSTEFRNLDPNNPSDKKIYDRGRKDIPMNISIAEPSSAK